jgi:hypothetical protein
VEPGVEKFIKEDGLLPFITASCRTSEALFISELHGTRVGRIGRPLNASLADLVRSLMLIWQGSAPSAPAAAAGCVRLM